MANREQSPLLEQKLHAFLATAVCRVYDEFGSPDQPPEDDVVQQRLLGPLRWQLCSGDPEVVFAGLDQHKTPSNFCGKVFKSGEPAYFCKDCQTDPTCCLCMECFEKSEHKNHRYRLFASGGGGCCDCGDLEAWRSNVYCDLHAPSEDDGEEVDPLSSLSPDMLERAQVFFATLLWYCVDVQCWDRPRELPQYLMQSDSAQSFEKDTFLTLLYNDEVHSYDEVIYTLTRNVQLTRTEAVNLATLVDRKGRAVAKTGSEQDCLQCKEVVNSGLTSTEPLRVSVLHSTVVAHQNNSILVLSLIKDLAERSAAFRRLISIVMVDTVGRPGSCILDHFFLNDNSLWISARINWHRLVMSSVFMDPVYKSDLAINLSKNYSQLQKNYIKDSHHHDVCASNITVQIFTVPSLCRLLVEEHGVLETILSTVLDVLAPCKDPSSGLLKLNTPHYKHHRFVYLLYDLRYVLRNKPEKWSQCMIERVLVAFERLLELLSLVQNADPVKRQKGFHVEQENPWEHTFNFCIVLQPTILMFVEWCKSNEIVLRKTVQLALAKYMSSMRQMKAVSHSVDQALVGTKKMALIPFDILREKVSIHQPLQRLIAGLLTGASIHNLSLVDLLRVSPAEELTLLQLMEHSSRALVMAVQVLAGMWKRNGYSVVNQVINYQFYYSREIMYDRDIVMLQSMAAILNPNVFLYSLIYKFRLEKWLTCPSSNPMARGEPSEDALRFFISEAEEFFFLLITIFAERYTSGIGEGVTPTDTLRREIIHKLYITPLTHSELLKQFRMQDNENAVDQLLKEVATLRRSGSSGKSVFELKPAFEKEYNPFFYHYNKVDHSKAEDTHRRKIKEAGGVSRVTPSPPQRPPAFCQPFARVMRLSQCSVLHRVLHCVFKSMSAAVARSDNLAHQVGVTHSSTESKFWSDKLLHEALHLCALMLSDEEPTNPASLCRAAIGRFGNNSMLELLEPLLNDSRTEEHRPLLSWIVQYLHRACELGPGSPAASPMTAVVRPIDEEPDGPAVSETERKQLAQKRRDRIMAQMAEMQKKFLSQHRQEIEAIDNSSPEEETCILCQEEAKECVAHEKPFVQSVCIQRSAMLQRRGGGGGEGPMGGASMESGGTGEETRDFLCGNGVDSHGLFTGGCGHHIHAECWRKFHDGKQREHARQHFFALPGHSVRWQLGEFLCPLCQCFANTVLPVLPTPKVKPQEPVEAVGFATWMDLVIKALDLAENPSLLDGRVSSVDPTLTDRLVVLYLGYTRPSIPVKRSTSHGEDTSIDSMIGLFSQSVYMQAYEANPQEDNDRSCLAQWNNCAYTIASLEFNARSQGKFLFESLSSRQLATVASLVRLGSQLTVRPSIEMLGRNLREFLNSFLLQMSPFTELPCVLEVDCFTILTNLHFTMASLFATLTSPSGAMEDSAVALSLVRLTYKHLVQTCAAACVLQYLLTCSPGMETDATVIERADSFPELAVGHALRLLWMRFRSIASLSCDCPPSPYDLCVGVQEHLYPFLQSASLFLHAITGVNFVYSSASLATRFSDLCNYLSLPPSIDAVFEQSGGQASLMKMAELWCSHPRLNQLASSSWLTPVLLSPRHLVDLPHDFSELVKKASSFKCPKRVGDRDLGDDGQAAMLCLVCGEMLCTNSYCCQRQEDGHQQDSVRIGGFTQHAQRCGAGVGMALWILESYIVLLDATRLSNVRGCTVTPPYFDEYGEADPGLRRGNPLKLSEERYHELQQFWFHHQIPMKVVKEMENNRSLIAINWAKM